MKKFNINSIVTMLAASAVFVLTGPIVALAAGPAPVNLLSAGNFAILSETGITNTGSHTTVITGNIGSSPITAAAMNNVFCSEITGTIYGVNAAYTGSGVTTCFAGNPPLSNKTLVDNAVLDMGTAYTDAAGRTLPTATELGAGDIGGMTLAPGLYKWSTDVNIPTNLTLSGGPNDVWIFQIAGNLSIASGGSVPAGIKVVLTGGAKASNVFWQVGGPTGATLGTYSTFNGTILSAKQVIIQTGAVLNGRALAQTQVTLDANTVSVPVTTPINPTSVQVHLFKYLDEVKATAAHANSVSFPMLTTYNDPNVGSGTNVPFTISPSGWTTGDIPYESSTGPRTPGSSASFLEDTGTALVGASCDGLHTYALTGYSIGDTLAAAATATSSLIAPNFSSLSTDEYVIVWNRTCPGSLKVTKNTIGGDGTFLFTGNAGSFSITTSGGSGSTTISLLPGTYTVTETTNPAWTMNSNTCLNIVVAMNQTATCTITNTRNPGIVITNNNNGSITSTTTSSSSTGNNTAGGSQAGNGGNGGKISAGTGNLNNGGATSGTGGRGGNSGMGGTVQTGNATSSAISTNILNNNRIHIR